MEKVLGKVIAGLLTLLILPAISAMFGYVGGWVVSLIFDETIHSVVRILFNTTRFDAITLAQFGATISFFATWLKPVHYTESSSNE